MNTITLMNPFSSSLAPGEVVNAYPGCQRSEAICVSKYDNILNHMGWARIPTRNPFSGRIL